MVEAFLAESEKKRGFFPMEAAHQSLGLWDRQQARAAEDECSGPSPSRPRRHRPRISAEPLTGKSKGCFTTDYTCLKPEQMSGCLTAKDSPLAQSTVLLSIFFIWQDHRLQPPLIPFLCISFL